MTTPIRIGKPKARAYSNGFIVYGCGCYARMPRLDEAIREWRYKVSHRFNKSMVWCFGLKDYHLVFEYEIR